MKHAEDGSTIKVHYTGRLNDGTVFDSSIEREPLEFTIGSGGIIKGFEDGVLGMAVGDTRIIKIPSDEAYGPYKEDLVMNMGRSQLPPEINPKEGMMLSLGGHPSGKCINVMITEVTADSLTLNGNHPLAGKDLTFELELVEIS